MNHYWSFFKEEYLFSFLYKKLKEVVVLHRVAEALVLEHSV